MKRACRCQCLALLLVRPSTFFFPATQRTRAGETEKRERTTDSKSKQLRYMYILKDIKSESPSPLVPALTRTQLLTLCRLFSKIASRRTDQRAEAQRATPALSFASDAGLRARAVARSDGRRRKGWTARSVSPRRFKSPIRLRVADSNRRTTRSPEETSTAIDARYLSTVSPVASSSTVSVGLTAWTRVTVSTPADGEGKPTTSLGGKSTMGRVRGGRALRERVRLSGTLSSSNACESNLQSFPPLLLLSASRRCYASLPARCVGGGVVRCRLGSPPSHRLRGDGTRGTHHPIRIGIPVSNTPDGRRSERARGRRASRAQGSRS